MSNKLFANPNQLWIDDETYDVKIGVQFAVDDNGPYAHIRIFDKNLEGGDEEDEDRGLVTRFDLEMDTIKVIIDSGWHFGSSPPSEWNLEGEETIPPGTTIH